MVRRMRYHWSLERLRADPRVNRLALVAILCLLASLLVPRIASASMTTGAENRAGAFDVAEQVHVGVDRSLTAR